MTTRLRHAVFTASAFILTLSITAPAFADACSDARKALDDARKAMADTFKAMKAADLAAGLATPGTPQQVAALAASHRAEDAWLDANKDFRLKQAAVENCPQQKVESKNGVGWPYSSMSLGIQVVLDWLQVGPSSGGNNAIAAGAARESARQATKKSVFTGVMLSVVGAAEFTRSFGSTTPSFLGGVRGTKWLKAHPNFRPFGEVLAGIERCGECGTNDVALEFGVGTGYQRPQWDRLGIVGELSFRTLPGEGAGLQKRLVGGISYRFGPR